MLWIAVALSVLLLLSVVLLVRGRRPAAIRPEAQPMRATLERRLREGREFHL